MIPFPTYYTQNRTVQTRQALFKSSRRPHARAGIKYLTPKNKAMCLPVSFTRFIYNEGFDRAVRNAACQKADFLSKRKTYFGIFLFYKKQGKSKIIPFLCRVPRLLPLTLLLYYFFGKKAIDFPKIILVFFGLTGKIM